MTDLNQEPQKHIDRTNLSRVQTRRQKNKKNKIIAGFLMVAIVLVALVPTVQYFFANNPTEKISEVSPAKTKKTTSKPKIKNKPAKKSSSKAKSQKKTPTPKSQPTQEQTNPQNQNEQATNQQNQTNETPQTETAGSYTVQAGDSLYSIATNNGLTLDQLMQMNGLTPSAQLQPGMQLKIK